MAGAGGLVAGRRAVLLDFDGTIFELVQDFGRFRARWGTGPVLEILAGLRGEDEAAALAELEQVDLAGVRNGRPLIHSQLLDRLLAVYPVAVVSRNAEQALRLGLAQLGAAEVPVVGRESVQHHKPDPEPVRLALELLHAGTGILVGDTSHDVEAAKAAGIPSAVVRNPKLAFQPKQADYYLERMSDLPELLEEIWQRPI